MKQTPLERLQKAKQKAIYRNLDKWMSPTRIVVGMSTCEIAAGSRVVMETILEEIRKQKITGVHVGKKGCVGRCHLEPTVEVYQAGKIPFKYENVDAAKAVRIVADHLVKNNVPSPEPVAWNDPVSKDVLTDRSRYVFGDIPYFRRQKRIVLRNCGIIDPESIDDYLSVRGFEAIATVLTRFTPDQVITEVEQSGLRGRGGGGFPTGVKWRMVAVRQSPVKYVICNADEGDPGAFMDRSVIEGDPFSVLEAMTIGGFAVGANQGIVYIRAEYPLAVERLRIAIVQARELGLLGKNILGTGFSFDIELVLGAGAFVCGEETALIHSIEGARGMPRTRPPYPAQSGLWGKPTLINNVETWANIPVIILDGWKTFASIGTEKSKGTKVFALAGKVKNTGLVEVPMGTTLGEVIFDIGGGIRDGRKFKTAQTGGPSGGCLPPQFLNTPIDYDSLVSAGSIMGSGGLIVMDERDCMVDVAKFFLEFTQDESCGKCTPCREGTNRMLEILTRISNGRGKEGDIEKLERLGNTIKKTAMCALGQTAPNPVLSTLRYFRNEYESHIRRRMCPTAVCGELFSSPCQHTCPAHIDIPGFIGLLRQGKIRESLALIMKRNPLPSICGRICHHPCEANCRRGNLDEPLSVMLLKRFVADAAAADDVKLEGWKGTGKKEPVAVIGGGPAGLSCAYHMAKHGYDVTLFEAEKEIGGMLSFGIPAYRLPRDVVKRDIGRIIEAGVTVKAGTALGKDVSLATLKEKGFKAVFLAIGAWKEMALSIPGTELSGVVGSLSFLKKYNQGGELIPVTGKKVAVIGGGNAAMDVARTCLRLGAAEVHIVYRRTREAMPAIPEEILDGGREGLSFHFLLIPSVIRGENGRVTELVCRKTTPGVFDTDGRRKPVMTGEEEILSVDVVISAIGGRPSFPDIADPALRLNENGTVPVNALTFETNIPGVFAAGDAVTGGGTVIGSIAMGEEAAISITRYLRGEDLVRDRFIPRGKRNVVTDLDLNAGSHQEFRPESIKLSLEKRIRSFAEVEQGYSRNRAMFEANRCLRCDKKEAETDD